MWNSHKRSETLSFVLRAFHGTFNHHISWLVCFHQPPVSTGKLSQRKQSFHPIHSYAPGPNSYLAHRSHSLNGGQLIIFLYMYIWICTYNDIIPWFINKCAYIPKHKYTLHICVYIYVYILHKYIHVYMYICIHMYMYIFVQKIFQTGKCRYLFAKIGSPTHNTVFCLT